MSIETPLRSELAIDGMTCNEVAAVDGVTSVQIALDAKTVAVEGVDNSTVVAAIDEAGYDVA